MGVGKEPGSLCICEICTCGRHRCVHHPVLEKNKEKGKCVLTEYKDTYRKHDAYQPTRILKPNIANKVQAGEFDPNTSYKLTYVPHEVRPRVKRETTQETPRYTHHPGKFDGTSSYRYDYTEKAPSKAPSARPLYRPTTAPGQFESTTVHRETYRPWELEIRKGIRQPPALKLPTGKFTHQSTAHRDFKAHQTVAREAVRKPEPSLAVSPGEFYHDTTTRHDYTAKTLPTEKMVKRQHQLVRHEGPFDHKTMCQTAYIWRDGRPADTCKPPDTTKLSAGKLECDTTNNVTYKAWNVPREKTGKPRTVWVAPSEPFNHKSTVQRDYDGKRAEPAKSARPGYRQTDPGEFDGLTTHNAEFKSWEVKPRKSYRPVQTYEGPQSKFDGESTFQVDFKPFQVIQRKAFMPKEEGLAFTGDQDFRTMYRDTYLGAHPPPCPAKSLVVQEGSPSITGLVYTGDVNGHQYFSPGEDKTEKSEKSEIV